MTKPEIRPATPADAAAMCAVINPLIEAGGTTAHQTPFTIDRMTSHYIQPPKGISCTVAVRDGRIVGFQVTYWADPTAPDRLPADWAVIASFVSPEAQGSGVGKALFAKTLKAARQAGVVAIDARIRRYNTGGLAFYSSLGFRDERSDAESIAKVFRL